jgi:Sec-independent protein secretion pathway component TatC
VIVICFIVAAVITPTPDPITQTLVGHSVACIV